MHVDQQKQSGACTRAALVAGTLTTNFTVEEYIQCASQVFHDVIVSTDGRTAGLKSVPIV